MTKKQDPVVELTTQAKEVVDAVANILGVAATELWSIVVRKYVVQGLNELFIAIVLFVGSFFLWQYIEFWALIPISVGVAFVFGAINYLGNPKYYAIDDIIKRAKTLKKDTKPGRMYY